MTPNSLYPGFIKLHHEAPKAEHIYTLPVKPFLSVGGDYWLEEKAVVGGENWVAALTRYITAIKPLIVTTQTFTYAELWTMATPTADPIYQDTATLNIAGTGGASMVEASQITFSFRTSEGGNGKVVMLDQVLAVNAKYRAPYTSVVGAVVTYLLSSQCCIFGRDGGYPVAVVKALTKTNDVLRRKYGLS